MCTMSGSTCETACRNGRHSFCVCYDPAGGAMRLEYNCFTDVACTNPQPDGGTDAGSDAGTTSDAGTDAGNGIKDCPVGIMTGDDCTPSNTAANNLCVTPCTNRMQHTCSCGRTGWRCTANHACLQ
jgi:hypothetical protein